MNSGDSPQQRTTLWFGGSLSQFLREELKDFPQRRVAALRLFVVTLCIVTVSQSLHVPPLGAIALLICLSYDAYANAGQSLLFGIRQFGYILVTTLISVLTLMLAGNEPWLLFCLSFIIMALALFHSRLIAWPTGIALWFAIAILYNPGTPEADVYQALWNIPIIGVLALGSWTVVHLTIKPQDPLQLLKTSIAAQLAAVEHLFHARMADSGWHAPRPAVTKRLHPGGLGKALGLLANAELLHPGLQRRHDTYQALLLEIDGLLQLSSWLDQALAAEYRAQPLSPQKLRVYLNLQNACVALQAGILQSRDVAAQIDALLVDEVLHDYAGLTYPSLLTALWRAVQRISGLIHELHQPPQAVGDTESAGPPAQSGLPAWFGYEFWVTHADSLQFGIKFSIGAMLCTLIINSLGWADINTAIPTCLVAAQTSLGADYRLSLLRVSGAFLGGVCAYFYVLVFQSQLDTLAGFLLTTAPFWALAAWITAGSERIAYMGRQLGFSFAMFVLHDFGAVTNLYLPRDRVIGIVLGLIVMGVLDYALWPRRSMVLARHHAVSALRTLSGFTRRLPDSRQLLNYTLPLRLAAEKDLAAAQDLLGHARLEPDALRPTTMQQRAALRTIIADTGQLCSLLQIRKRYRLFSGQPFSDFPDELQQYSHDFDAALATALQQSASLLQGELQGTPSNMDDSLQRLHQSYAEHHRISSLPADAAVEWQLRFMLDKQIVALITQIDRAVVRAG
jgi:uncharacterized membrane protein YgaE (UPF0421/DUF939 family)